MILWHHYLLLEKVLMLNPANNRQARQRAPHRCTDPLHAKGDPAS
jgi:hypothetical protein